MKFDQVPEPDSVLPSTDGSTPPTIEQPVCLEEFMAASTPIKGVGYLTSPSVLPEDNTTDNLVGSQPVLVGTPIIAGNRLSNSNYLQCVERRLLQ